MNPSRKTLCERLGLDDAQSKRLKDEMTRLCDQWSCSDEDGRIVLELASELMDAEGVEYVEEADLIGGGFYYVSVGDPYHATIVFDLVQGVFKCVSGYGDYIETQEKLGRKFV